MAAVQKINPHLRDIHAPAPLRDMPYWLVWRYETHESDKKPRKVPLYANGERRYGQQGAPKDLAKLTTFAVARDAAIRRNMDGVGFAHTEAGGIVTLDFDNCVHDGVVDPQVLDLVGNTYAEFSPSGKGVHAIFSGSHDVLGNPKSHATPEQFGVEAFSSVGFTTFSGWMLDHVDLLGYEDRVAPLPQPVIEFCQTRFGPSTPAKVDPLDFMIGHEPRLGLTVDQIEEAISNLDPDMGREDWIKIGMAISHECDGDDTGFEIFNEWSACGSKYPSEEALRQQWDSFGRPRAGRRQVTMATVLRMAKEANVTPEKLRQVATEAALLASTSTLGVTPPDYDGKFPLRRAGDIARLPAGKWWIKGLIPKAQIGAIFGASGSGKSFLALDFMAHLSMGTPWRGRTVVKARGLYVAAEGGTGVGKRIKAWAQHNKVDADDLSISVLTVPPNIMLKDDIEELTRSVMAAGGFDYVVLDTYAQVTPGANENAAEDMGKALAHCRALSEATGGMMVILVHHSGKDASRGVRGWSGINAALDFAVETTRDEDSEYREMKVTKMKDGEDGLKFGFKLTTVTVGIDDDLEEITSCVIEELETQKPKEKTTERGLKRRGRVENHVLETMTLFGGRDTVKLHELVEQAVSTMPVPEVGERDTRRQRVVRAIQQLGKEKDGPLQVKDNLVIFYE